MNLIAIATMFAALLASTPAQDPEPAPIRPATVPSEQPSATSAGTTPTPQDGKAPPAYPERDALTPFRNPTDIYAPPDELFRQLRIMQNIAARPNAAVSYDEKGREVVDDPIWRQARQRVDELGIDGGMLAQMMRLHRNALQRDTAFFAAFYVENLGYVMDLIAHIPGEPERSVREAAFPRAVEFLRVHLPRRFGELTEDEQAVVLQAMPEPGSPAAKARGLTRAPIDTDHLHTLRLTPFFQLLDVDEPLDQAQGLWFLKEVFRIRPDLAELWLEPALPRLRQLLVDAESDQVRAEAVAIYRQIGPDKLGPPPAERDALTAWADRAARHMFPPIRNLNDAIVQLHPSEQRDRIAEAGIRALENSGIGDPYRGQKKDGTWFGGFRVGHVPPELEPLAIRPDSIITHVNGTPVHSAQELLAVVRKYLRGSLPRRLLVEYVRKGKPHAIEYRVM